MHWALAECIGDYALTETPTEAQVRLLEARLLIRQGCVLLARIANKARPRAR
jgi:predicted trehalose synthase